RTACVNFNHRLVSVACGWLSWFLHTKHSFNPQHHQTPSESFRKGEKAGMRAGDKVLPASCRKIKLNNNTICDSEIAKAVWHGTALGRC
ncbi:MAG TPA: hypothetical protein VNX46_14780, partial [Candidatus Acidoferrum sp.]|nr:hypothetical protein [Candidatus Acidoferrum sp.]